MEAFSRFYLVDLMCPCDRCDRCARCDAPATVTVLERIGPGAALPLDEGAMCEAHGQAVVDEGGDE